MPEEAAGRTLKIRLSGHHPQKKSGVGEEPGRKGRPNKCPGAVVWEEFCCVMWRSCQSFLEGWGLSGVAEEWSSNLKSWSWWSRHKVMVAEISQEVPWLDY